MSVGHVARLLEGAGIPTVIIAVRAFQARLAGMTVARLASTPHVMGRPLGPPNDREEQQRVVRRALDLATNAREAGTVLELEGSYRPSG